MEDIQTLKEQLEILELIKEALEIRLDAYSMIPSSRHAELLESYRDAYQQPGDEKSPVETKEKDVNSILNELEERIEKSKNHKVHFIIQKPQDEFGSLKRRYNIYKKEISAPEPERDLTFSEMIVEGHADSSINGAKTIAQYFLTNNHVYIDGLVETMKKPRSLVLFYLRIFKSQGLVQYHAEDDEKYYVLTEKGYEFLNDFVLT